MLLNLLFDSFLEYFDYLTTIFVTIFVTIIFICTISIFVVIILCRSEVSIALNCNKTNQLEYYTVRSTCKRIYSKYFNTIRNLQITIISVSVFYILLYIISFFIKKTLHHISSYFCIICIIFILVILMYVMNPAEKNEIAKKRYDDFRSKFNHKIENYKDSDYLKNFRNYIKTNIKYVHDVVDADFIYANEMNDKNLLDYISTYKIKSSPEFSFMEYEIGEFNEFRDFIENSNIDIDKYQDDPNYKVMRYYTDRLYGTYILNDFHIIDIISFFIVVFIYLILIDTLMPNTNYVTLFFIVILLILSCIYFSDVIIKVRK